MRCDVSKLNATQLQAANTPNKKEGEREGPDRVPSTVILYEWWKGACLDGRGGGATVADARAGVVVFAALQE